MTLLFPPAPQPRCRTDFSAARERLCYASSHTIMRPLSATESITPAIDRTKHLLFSPFRKGRTWKLCATSYACRFGALYLPFPLLYLAMFPAFRRAGTAFFALIAVVILVLLALFTWVFHLCSRLQFAYFDMGLCGKDDCRGSGLYPSAEEPIMPLAPYSHSKPVIRRKAIRLRAVFGLRVLASEAGCRRNSCCTLQIVLKRYRP